MEPAAPPAKQRRVSGPSAQAPVEPLRVAPKRSLGIRAPSPPRKRRVPLQIPLVPWTPRPLRALGFRPFPLLRGVRRVRSFRASLYIPLVVGSLTLDH